MWLDVQHLCPLPFSVHQASRTNSNCAAIFISRISKLGSTWHELSVLGIPGEPALFLGMGIPAGQLGHWVSAPGLQNWESRRQSWWVTGVTCQAQVCSKVEPQQTGVTLQAIMKCKCQWKVLSHNSTEELKLKAMFNLSNTYQRTSASCVCYTLVVPGYWEKGIRSSRGGSVHAGCGNGQEGNV